MRFRSFCPVWISLVCLPALAQRPKLPPRTSPAASSPAARRARIRQEALTLRRDLRRASGEPGAELRVLRRYLKRHPHTPAKAQLYRVMIHDADKLNDMARVLRYDIALQKLRPGDLGQRIRTLNLLLLSHQPQQIRLARQFARELRALVKIKAAHPKLRSGPDAMTPAQWTRAMNKLRSLADLLAGTADRKAGNFRRAVVVLRQSLKLEPTEEAASELGRAYQAQNQIASAVRAYALALALPGDTMAERYALQLKAGKLYAGLHHGSQAGFGDLVLGRFDSVAAKLPQPGKPWRLENMVFRDLAGGKHTLGQYRGRVVVLDLWATWCGPCREEHPLLRTVERKYAGNPRVKFIFINADRIQSVVLPFVKKEGWGGKSWLEHGLMTYLGLRGLPTTLILSAKGKIVFRQSGFDPATYQQQLESAIDHQLRTKSVTGNHAPRSAS